MFECRGLNNDQVIDEKWSDVSRWCNCWGLCVEDSVSLEERLSLWIAADALLVSDSK